MSNKDNDQYNIVISSSAVKIKEDIDKLNDEERGPFSKMVKGTNSNGQEIWTLSVLAYFNSEFTDFNIWPDSTTSLTDRNYRDVLPLYSVEISPDHESGDPDKYTLWEFTIELNYQEFRSGVYLEMDEKITWAEPKRGTTTMPEPVDT